MSEQQHGDQGRSTRPPAATPLDDLRHVVETARTVPMSSSVRVNRAEVLELVDRVRGTMPDQLAQADDALAEARRALDGARAQADEILATARTRAYELVQREQVVAQAEARAHEIVDAAQRSADELRSDADDYCDRALAHFEGDLGKLLAQVQAGRARIAERSGPRPGPRPDGL
ncbi:ATP synthase F0 subunit B [Cellulomonas sp. PhB143]|uniref:ATP synthase F0 subunit B n=1 Tax=Cellulomonas sp. PhB143 TaxID=2485186 RepID=UPI000F462C4B|nr:ATP synthase F0 subunit B [Cellulomonas sp. PhB143]ROS73568.1 hypothetical protein EDF32_2420 [Cellulomonas sp. PhB143]